MLNPQTLGCDAKNVSLHLVAEQCTMKHATQDEGVWKLKIKKKKVEIIRADDFILSKEDSLK